MTLIVQMIGDYTDEEVSFLQAQLAANIRLVTADEILPDGGCHILVQGRPKREFVEANPDLHTIIVPWTGIPPQTRSLLLDYPQIALHNIHHNTVPVAEMAIALLLAAAKQVVYCDQALRQGDWTPRYQTPSPSMLLSGKNVLILGYGAIGRHTARICRSLGMDVLATRQRIDHVAADDLASEIHPAQHLSQLLPRVQAVIIALPLTPVTEGLVGQRELALLPPGSVLVNVGRAAVVNEAALYRALKAGQLGAAGLDVWYNYPEGEEAISHTYPATLPFWELDNVVLSPHRAGHVPEVDYLRMDKLADLLNASAAGNELVPNRVDLHAGY